MITIEQLTDMFDRMRTGAGYKKWNVDGDLLWGYFFTDGEVEKLQSAADHLATQGYRFVRIFHAEGQAGFFLHVERVEHHTPESLHHRNQDFYRLAEHFHLESYDGMDVGPVV